MHRPGPRRRGSCSGAHSNTTPRPEGVRWSLVKAAAKDHRVRHDELVLALVLANQQRHVLLVDELEADLVEQPPDCRL